MWLHVHRRRTRSFSQGHSRRREKRNLFPSTSRLAQDAQFRWQSAAGIAPGEKHRMRSFAASASTQRVSIRGCTQTARWERRAIFRGAVAKRTDQLAVTALRGTNLALLERPRNWYSEIAHPPHCFTEKLRLILKICADYRVVGASLAGPVISKTFRACELF